MTDNRFDVVVVGNAGIDTNVYLPGRDIDFDVEANFTRNVDYVGQAGGYTSRGYAQMGKRTAFIGHVGDDHCGRFVRDEFARDGIDSSALFVDPKGTARSVNFMYRDGRRKNFYDGKGHMSLKPDLDICRSVLEGSRLAHFHIPNWARDLLPIARDLGVVIACDIQDITSPHDRYRQDFVESAEFLFFSAANYRDPGPLIRSFLAVQPELVIVVGMGSRGCALGTRERIEVFPPVDMDTPVVDTNGAGDALAVGFLSSHVLGGYSLHDSILRGQIAARHTCTQKASTSNLIGAEQLDQVYEELAPGRS